MYLLTGLAFSEHGVLPLAAGDKGRQFLIPRGEFSIIIAGLITTAASAGLITFDHRFGPSPPRRAPQPVSEQPEHS